MNKMTALPRVSIKWSGPLALVVCMLLWNGSSGIAKNARPCDDDVEKFCKDAQRGNGRVVKCLQDHEKEVSLACKQDITEMKSRMRGFMESCEDDVSKYCKDITPGEGRIIQCLKGHEKQLASQCKANLPPER